MRRGFASTERASDPPSSLPGEGGDPNAGGGKAVMLTLFGGMTIQRDGRVLPVRSRKAQALFAFLAIESPSSGVSRERLCDLLWSESSEEKARASLRQALHELKSVLDREGPGLLRAGRDLVELSSAAASDAAEVLERLRHGEVDPRLLGREDLTGSFLAGFEDLDPSFRTWLLARRQSLHDQAIRALELILRDEKGPKELADQAAAALLNLDPTHEEACRHVMQEAASRGDIARALKTYKRLWDLLEEEYGSEPSEQTRALAVRIKIGVAPVRPGEARASDAPGEVPSLAVLPFTNMSGDPEQDYFADGIAEDITTALSRIRWFFVMARNSSFAYKGRAVDVREISRDLGVRYILEGSVRRAGTKLRINAQLLDATSGHHIWADRYDGTLDDVFEFQDRMTQSVVGALEPSLRRAEIERAYRKPTNNLAAYDYLLRALPLIHVGEKGGILHARALLRSALENDPNCAHAWALQARCCVASLFQNWGTEIDRLEGERSARTAIELGQEDPLALAEAAVNLACLTRDYSTAQDAMDRSLALHPSAAETHNKAGWLRVYLEEPAPAIAHFETAVRLSPTDLAMCHFLTGYAAAHVIAQRWEQACHYATKALALNSGWATAHRLRIVALVNLGHLDEARAVAQTLLKAVPSFRISEYGRYRTLRTEALWLHWLDCLRASGLPE